MRGNNMNNPPMKRNNFKIQAQREGKTEEFVQAWEAISMYS
jgi:hypothetical protein